jgi:hypothetical protein
MIYRVQIKKGVHSIKVYNLLKKTGPTENALTKLFERIFIRKKPAEGA